MKFVESKLFVGECSSTWCCAEQQCLLHCFVRNHLSVTNRHPLPNIAFRDLTKTSKQDHFDVSIMINIGKVKTVAHTWLWSLQRLQGELHVVCCNVACRNLTHRDIFIHWLLSLTPSPLLYGRNCALAVPCGSIFHHLPALCSGWNWHGWKVHDFPHLPVRILARVCYPTPSQVPCEPQAIFDVSTRRYFCRSRAWPIRCLPLHPWPITNPISTSEVALRLQTLTVPQGDVRFSCSLQRYVRNDVGYKFS